MNKSNLAFKSIVFIILIICELKLQSQTKLSDFGIKINGGVSTLFPTINDIGNKTIFAVDGGLGYAVGGGVYFATFFSQSKKAGIESNLLLGYNGFDNVYSEKPNNNPTKEIKLFKMMNLSLPILFKIKMFKKMYFNFGGAFTYLVGFENTHGLNEYRAENLNKTNVYGIASLELVASKNFKIDVRTSMNILPLLQQDASYQNEFNIRPINTELGLTFLFHNKRRSSKQVEQKFTIISSQAVKIIDTDKDGVENIADNCPIIPGLASNGGCPLDSDKDGVSDKDDKCPTQPGDAIYNGCPHDADNDGVIDAEDNCPNVFGTKKNNGCADVVPKAVPEILPEIKKVLSLALVGIQFEPNKSKLKSTSNNLLINVANILRSHPKYKLFIVGHTDDTGTPEQNLLLSKQRAESVKTFLQTKGIAANRLKTDGKGSSKPIFTDKNKTAQTMNRRVELSIIE